MRLSGAPLSPPPLHPSSVCFLWLAERSWSRQINGRIDARDYLCGAAWARGSTRRVSCGFFRDATSHLCGVFMLVSVVDCLSAFVCPLPPHTLLSILCVFVCLCVRLSSGAPLTQSASALIPEGADGGAARALPCPPNTRSC